MNVYSCQVIAWQLQGWREHVCTLLLERMRLNSVSDIRCWFQEGHLEITAVSIRYNSQSQTH